MLKNNETLLTINIYFLPFLKRMNVHVLARPFPTYWQWSVTLWLTCIQWDIRYLLCTSSSRCCPSSWLLPAVGNVSTLAGVLTAIFDHDRSCRLRRVEQWGGVSWHPDDHRATFSGLAASLSFCASVSLFLQPPVTVQGAHEPSDYNGRNGGRQRL